jgi:hypothetical protein
MLRKLLPAIALVLLAAPAANADSVSVSGCTNCFGMTFSLTVVNLGGNLYQATLAVDTAGFSGAPSGVSYISAVNFKVDGDIVTPPDPSLTSDPGGNWTTLFNSPIDA